MLSGKCNFCTYHIASASHEKQLKLYKTSMYQKKSTPQNTGLIHNYILYLDVSYGKDLKKQKGNTFQALCNASALHQHG